MPYLVCARSFVISAFDIRSIFLFFFSICKHTQYAKSTLNRKAHFMTETLFDFNLSSTYYVEFEHHTTSNLIIYYHFFRMFEVLTKFEA